MERAAVVGVDAILAAYEGMNNGIPYYSVWFTKQEKAFQFNENDVDKGEECLRAWLNAIANSGERAMYYLRIHPDSQPVYRNTSDVICTIPIRPNALVDSQIAGTGIYDFSASRQMNDKIAALEKRIEELMTEDVEEQGNPILNQISGLLNNEHVAPVIGQILQVVMNKLLPNSTLQSSSTSAVSMAGIDEPQPIVEPGINNNGESKYTAVYWARVNNALGRLQSHVDLADGLEKLADLAEKNPAMFQMLLKNLL